MQISAPKQMEPGGEDSIPTALGREAGSFPLSPAACLALFAGGWGSRSGLAVQNCTGWGKMHSPWDRSISQFSLFAATCPAHDLRAGLARPGSMGRAVRPPTGRRICPLREAGRSEQAAELLCSPSPLSRRENSSPFGLFQAQNLGQAHILGSGRLCPSGSF